MKLIKEIKEQKELIQTQGRIIKKRDLGKIFFLELSDFTGSIQVVVEKPELLTKLQDLHPETIISLSALVKKSPSDKPELHAQSLEIISAVEEVPDLELQSKEIKENLDTQLKHRAIGLRHKKNKAIFKVQAKILEAYREFMTNLGCTEIFTPLLLASSSEGGAEIFHVDYFEKQATLAQSAQLYKQIMVGVFDRVFGLSKCFRAELSNTRRHLTEGSQLEFEFGYIEGLETILKHEEAALRHILKKVYKDCQVEMQTLKAQELMVPKETFPTYSFKEACQVLTEKFNIDTLEWDDLSTEAEKLLCQYARETYKSDFIFITHIPKGAFYAFRDDNGIIHNVDLLCKEMEISSGGRRIDDYDQLRMSIMAAGMDPKDFSEYLSIFKFGMPAHGGFGLGLERLTMLICNQDNIRQTTLFPSDPKRVASQQL